MSAPGPGEGQRPRLPGVQMADVVAGILARLRLKALEERYSPVAVVGLFAFVNGCLSIAIMSAVAWATGQPFIFPSLGPTAFLLFYSPMAPAASPRNTVVGHLIGVVAGFLSLALFGLLDVGPAFAEGVSAARIGAAALSLGATAGFMAWLRVPHPPAGATTLIVSLGILRTPADLAALMAAVVLLVVQGFAINRLAGLDYPVWRAHA